MGFGGDFTYDAIKNAFVKRKPLGDAIHRKIMKTFRTYMAVGGCHRQWKHL